MVSLPRPTGRHSFEVAIFCALTLEADAVHALFDFHWDDNGSPLDKALGDPNIYSTGAIGRHNVVLTHMPGMGKANAAIVAANCHLSFPNVKLALVVSVCGAVPFNSHGEEIVLGDVIVSEGIVQHDLGWRLSERFMRKDTLLDSLGRPNTEIHGLVAKLKGLRGRQVLQSKVVGYLGELQAKPLAAEYPGVMHDKLFESEDCHAGIRKLGEDGKLIQRRRLQDTVNNPEPAVHFSLIASGDSVMMSGKQRDDIAAKEAIIAFEMEGAGVWDTLPCIVIKGACDYADSY